MWTAKKDGTHEELRDQIQRCEKAMDAEALSFWKAIRLEPVKWQLHPWGDEGGGLWVVAIFGRHVLWFNDIEWGFNLSQYDAFGDIGQYICNQDELQHSMFAIKRLMTLGERPGGFGPPKPV